MKHLSIKQRLLFVIIMSIIGLSIALIIVNTISLKELADKNINIYKKNVLNLKKEKLHNYTTIVMNIIKPYYERTNKNKLKYEVKNYITQQSDLLFNIIEEIYNLNKDKMSKKELKNLIIKTVAAARYGKNGYFWINNMNYKMIMHPIKKELTGKYFKNNPKVPFVALGVNKLKKNGKNIAYIAYNFYSPKSKKYVYKFSIVRVFKPYNWVIGTGAYIDDVTEKMKKEALNAISKIRYGKNGYFWINNMNYKMIMHPIKKELTGKYFKNNPKVPFVALGVNALKKSSKDDAIIKYSFFNPATGKYGNKISDVRLFKPWGWVIGTGVYLTDIELNIKKMKTQEEKIVKKDFIKTLIVSFAMLMITIIAVLFLIKKWIVDLLITWKTQ